MGKSFRYLGRYFDFNMSDEEHKSELLDVFNDIMNKINELPLHPKNKILLYSRYLLSKMSVPTLLFLIYLRHGSAKR
jgi:hypothetical protein